MSSLFDTPIPGIDQQDVLKLISELRRESDRGMVLVCVAIIDNSVSAKIAQILMRGSKEARSRLLEPPMGALSGFMSRVDFAYCIGLYDRHIYEDVRLLNRLRVKCAHEWRAFRIDEEVIRRYIRPMHTWAWTAAAVDYLEKKEGLTTTTLDLFGITMAILITHANTAHPVGPLPHASSSDS